MNAIQLEIEKSKMVLQSGGVLLCPTDTIWGLSADATNFEAVEKVFVLKNRPAEKSMIILVSSIDMLKVYVEEIPNIAVELLEKSQTATSIIYPKGRNLAQNVLHQNGSLAIRIVTDNFCKPLIEKLGKPIISTSANVSGKETARSFVEIESELINKVDYCVNLPEKQKASGQSSALFLIEGSSYKQLR